MPRLVALDVPWDNAFPGALQRTWDAGDAAAPLDPRLPAAAARDLLNALRPTHLLDASGELTTLDGGLSVDDGDALVMATSGTSAAARGVVLSHAAVRASAEATSRRLDVDPAQDQWLACIPLSHIGGLGVVTRAMITGTPLQVHERFDAARVTAAGRSVTLISLVSAVLSQLDLSMFRLILLGGAAPPSVVAQNVVTTYGMTETCGGVVYDGLPLDGTAISIFAAATPEPTSAPSSPEPTSSGNQPTGEGEILLRGPSLLRCYRDGTDPLTEGGWFKTGDAGFIDTAGRLHVSGRMSETINTGGEKVWPASVERVLGTHPLVGAIAVDGRPDPKWGQRVVAFVVAKDASDPPTLDALRDFVSEQLPRWAAPHELVLLAELPRMPSGKVAKRLLP
ncbi:MAG: AMP-binding protein [Acidimicrobiales bacterium]